MGECILRRGGRDALFPNDFGDDLLMNAFDASLRQSDIGCHVLNMYYECLVYVDDIVLLSPSVETAVKRLYVWVYGFTAHA